MIYKKVMQNEFRRNCFLFDAVYFKKLFWKTVNDVTPEQNGCKRCCLLFLRNKLC